VFDSMKRKIDTIIGPETEDEMCWNFLYYYPSQPNIKCSSSSRLWSGDLDTEEKGTAVLDNHHFIDTQAEVWYTHTTEGGKILNDRFGPFGRIRHCVEQDIVDYNLQRGSKVMDRLLYCQQPHHFFENKCTMMIKTIIGCSCPANTPVGVELKAPYREAMDFGVQILGTIGFRPDANRCFNTANYDDTDLEECETACQSCKPCVNNCEDYHKCGALTNPCTLCSNTCGKCLDHWKNSDTTTDAPFTPTSEPTEEEEEKTTSTPTEEEKENPTSTPTDYEGGGIDCHKFEKKRKGCLNARCFYQAKTGMCLRFKPEPEPPKCEDQKNKKSCQKLNCFYSSKLKQCFNEKPLPSCVDKKTKKSCQKAENCVFSNKLKQCFHQDDVPQPKCEDQKK